MHEGALCQSLFPSFLLGTLGSLSRLHLLFGFPHPQLLLALQLLRSNLQDPIGSGLQCRKNANHAGNLGDLALTEQWRIESRPNSIESIPK